jgi:hypothetical protein
MENWPKIFKPSDWQPFLEQLKHLRSVDAGLDLIFDTIDNLLMADGFEEINELFPQINIEEYDDSLNLGFLTITIWCKTELPNRAEFYNRLYKKIIRDYPIKDVHSIMQGLE